MNLNNRHRFLTRHNRLTELFPHAAYIKTRDDSNTIFIMEGVEQSAIGMAWISHPMSGVDEKAVNSMAQSLQIHTWKPGSTVQFNLVASNNLEGLLNEHETIHDNYDEMAYKMTQMRIKAWREGSMTPMESYQETIARDMYVVVSAKLPIEGVVPTDKELEHAESHFTRFETSINEAGFNLLNLSQKGLSYVFNSILNPTMDANWRNDFEYDEMEPVRNHFLDKGSVAESHKDYIKINDYYSTMLTVKKLPVTHSMVRMAGLLGDVAGGEGMLGGNMMISLNIEIPNTESLRDKLSLKKAWNDKQAKAGAGRWFSSIGRREQEFDSLFECLEEGDKPVRGYLSVMLLEPSKQQLEEKVEKAKAFFKNSIKTTFFQDKYFVLPIFLDSFPLACNPAIAQELQRYKTMATSQIVQFAPVLSDWKGTGTQSLTLFSRSGQMMGFDPYDSKQSKNGIITARSGSGKSFLSNALITTEFCKKKSMQFIIDIGGSYEKLCDSFGGTYIDFDPSTNFVINPFEAVGRDDAEEANVINMLVGIVEMMAVKVSSSGDISDTLNAKESNVLTEIITNIYREMGGKGSIDEIVHRLKAHEDQTVRDMAYRLYRFTSDSETGKFFNGKSTVSIAGSKMTVLELKHLESMGPHIMSVALFLMMSMIADAAFHTDRGVRKLILIDEAWGILKKAPEEVKQFIETFYRRVRKSNGSTWIVTQSIEDLYESDVGVAIANNSQYKIFLGQSASSIENSRKNNYIVLSDYQRDLMASTASKPPYYSEMYIDADEMGFGVARLIVDRYHGLVYSTTATEVAAINKYVAEGLSYHEAILEVMYHEGSLKGELLEEYNSIKGAA